MGKFIGLSIAVVIVLGGVFFLGLVAGTTMAPIEAPTPAPTSVPASAQMSPATVSA